MKWFYSLIGLILIVGVFAYLQPRELAIGADTGATSPSTSGITTTTCSDNMAFGAAVGTELQADDSTVFTYTGNNWDAGEVSDGVYASNFGFSTSGTIDGIQVEILGWTPAGSGSYSDVVLFTSVDNRVGDDKGTGSMQTTEGSYDSFGGAADDWNASLTSAQVNASTFGVEICATAGAANSHLTWDHVRVTVTYTPAAGGQQSQSILWIQSD